jgi:hypothetical protein
MSSPPVFNGVRVTRSLVLCVYFVDRCLSFCPFSFGSCPFSIYGFRILCWCLQTFLLSSRETNCLSIDEHATGCRLGINWSSTNI